MDFLTHNEVSLPVLSIDGSSADRTPIYIIPFQA
jgi:hypothetical protein